MKTDASTRRFLTALASCAALGLGAFALGLALDSQALAFFATTACAFIGMIAVSDYSPALSYSAESAAGFLASTRSKTERIPLAA